MRPKPLDADGAQHVDRSRSGRCHRPMIRVSPAVKDRRINNCRDSVRNSRSTDASSVRPNPRHLAKGTHGRGVRATTVIDAPALSPDCGSGVGFWKRRRSRARLERSGRHCAESGAAVRVGFRKWPRRVALVSQILEKSICKARKSRQPPNCKLVLPVCPCPSTCGH